MAWNLSPEPDDELELVEVEVVAGDWKRSRRLTQKTFKFRKIPFTCKTKVRLSEAEAGCIPPFSGEEEAAWGIKNILGCLESKEKPERGPYL